MFKKETKKIEVDSNLNRKELEKILIDFKGGKTQLQNTIDEIVALHNRTLSFEHLKVSQTHLDIAAAHFNLIESITREQHNDLQDLIKAIKEK